MLQLPNCSLMCDPYTTKLNPLKASQQNRKSCLKAHERNHRNLQKNGKRTLIPAVSIPGKIQFFFQIFVFSREQFFY